GRWHVRAQPPDSTPTSPASPSPPANNGQGPPGCKSRRGGETAPRETEHGDITHRHRRLPPQQTPRPPPRESQRPHPLPRLRTPRRNPPPLRPAPRLRHPPPTRQRRNRPHH